MSNRSDVRSETDRPVLPWWRVPTMWLVVGGPATVVVAGFITLGLAIRGGDVPLPTQAVHGAEAPAQKARNHAVTPAR